MKKLIYLLLAGMLLFTGCGTTPTGDIEVHNAWVRPTVAGENAAVYFAIHNHTTEEDELLSVTSNIADTIEIHESKMENDIMQMSPLASVPLAADEELMFEPGGMHIMLINLKQDLVLGEHMGVVLHFKNHADIVVEVHIEEAMPEEDHGHE